MIYDRAADNDALRARLKRRGIDLVVPEPTTVALLLMAAAGAILRQRSAA